MKGKSYDLLQATTPNEAQVSGALIIPTLRTLGQILNKTVRQSYVRITATFNHVPVGSLVYFRRY